MDYGLRALAAIATDHHGVVGRTHAAALGVDRWRLHAAVTAGILVPAGRRSWRFAGTPLSWRGRLQAGLVDLGPDAVVGAGAAAALLGLDGFADGSLEFVIPRSQRGRATHGRVRAVGPVATIDRTVIDALACTSATLTIVHLAGLVGRADTANALDSAIRLRLTSVEFVRRRLAELRAGGRAGSVVLDELLTEGYLTTRERPRQDRRRNELHLLGKVPYFFCCEDVTEEPGYVAATVRAALAATSRAAS